MILSLALSALLASSSVGAQAAETADMILTGGRVVTLDDAQPEGQAIAIRNGRVLLVETSAEVAKFAGEERAKNGAYLWRTRTDHGVVVNNGTEVLYTIVGGRVLYARDEE